MKVGRNDPCPCGSGKKYKHCCIDKDNAGLKYKQRSLPDNDEIRKYKEFVESRDDSQEPAPTFNEFIGRPNMATDALRDIKEQAQGRVFTSENEIRGFLKEQVSNINIKPVDDFIGLSSAQMDKILNGNFADNGGFMTFNKELSASQVQDVPAVKQLRYFIEKLSESEKGMKATSKGNLSQAFVREFYYSFILENDFVDRNPKSEDRVKHITVMKEFLKTYGYIRFQNGYYSLTARGEKLYSNFDSFDIYLMYLSYYGEEFNWLYNTRFPDPMGFIQTSLIFCLYILHQKAQNFTTGKELADIYIKAFPGLVEDIGDRYGKIFITSGFAGLFLEDYGYLFGLVEQKITGQKQFSDEQEYRITQLFRDLFVWNI